MFLAKNPTASRRFFVFCNLVLIGTLYHRYEDPGQFGLIAGGLVIFSFFLMRAIRQIIS